MSLSIIIVNYKTPQLLANCLRTVYQQTHSIPFEVIVVDNASGDNSRELISSTFTGVRWIQMDYNAGFARANNAGIRAASGDAVLLLNSDTLIEEEAISKAYSSLIHSPYVACGVQLLNADRSPQISGNYFMKGGLNNLLPLPYIGRLIRWLGHSLRVKKPHVPDSSGEVTVDWINGAFLMVKKAAISKAGLLDEDFFLYAEEAEWCYRLGKVGKLVIFGQYKVIHLQGQTSNTAFNSSTEGYSNLYDRKGLQIMLSNFVRVRKQFGSGWFVFQVIVYTLTIPVFLAGHLITRIVNPRHPFGRFRPVRGFIHNIVKIWRLVPSIIRNSPFFYKVL